MKQKKYLIALSPQEVQDILDCIRIARDFDYDGLYDYFDDKKKKDLDTLYNQLRDVWFKFFKKNE